MSEFKPLSVIIPTFNEEDAIVECIESLLNGNYPFHLLEFIIADGNSTDKTIEKIKEFSKQHPEIKIKLINNPHKTQGYGLNIAIKNIDDKSEIILRADAHSVYPENYIMKCVKALLESGADNAGGVMVPVGKTAFQKAVAFCMTHPLGVGDAKFHLGNYSGFVDTVYLGCFKREVFNKVGLFDPHMTPNEDAELNLGILKSGGKIYLDSSIQVVYAPRDTIKRLILQYVKYGQGRCRTVKKHSKFTSVRQIIPPVWIIISLVSIITGIFYKLFFIPILFYLSVIFLISIKGVFINKSVSLLFSPLCFVIMHYAWGTGFILELLKTKNQGNVE